MVSFSTYTLHFSTSYLSSSSTFPLSLPLVILFYFFSILSCTSTSRWCFSSDLFELFILLYISFLYLFSIYSRLFTPIWPPPVFSIFSLTFPLPLSSSLWPLGINSLTLVSLLSLASLDKCNTDKVKHSTLGTHYDYFQYSSQYLLFLFPFSLLPSYDTAYPPILSLYILLFVSYFLSSFHFLFLRFISRLFCPFSPLSATMMGESNMTGETALVMWLCSQRKAVGFRRGDAD